MSSPALYPVKNAKGEVDGVNIAVSVSGFRDKIVIMVWTDGKIGRMLSVGLSPSLSGVSRAMRQDLERMDGQPGNESNNDVAEESDMHLMPASNLSVKPLIGSSSLYDSAGPIFASMVASVVSKQSPTESRSIIVGLGPSLGPKPGSEDFRITKTHRMQLLEIVKLVQQCRVW